MTTEYATERPDQITFDWQTICGPDLTPAQVLADCESFVIEANDPMGYRLIDAVTEYTIEYITMPEVNMGLWNQETLEYLADAMFTDILNAGHSPLVGYVQNVGMIE